MVGTIQADRWLVPGIPHKCSHFYTVTILMFHWFWIPTVLITEPNLVANDPDVDATLKKDKIMIQFYYLLILFCLINFIKTTDLINQFKNVKVKNSFQSNFILSI